MLCHSSNPVLLALHPLGHVGLQKQFAVKTLTLFFISRYVMNYPEDKRVLIRLWACVLLFRINSPLVVYNGRSVCLTGARGENPSFKNLWVSDGKREQNNTTPPVLHHKLPPGRSLPSHKLTLIYKQQKPFVSEGLDFALSFLSTMSHLAPRRVIFPHIKI